MLSTVPGAQWSTSEETSNMAADDDTGEKMTFDVLCASPLKSNDESSVDIYAGLDPNVTENTSKPCTPSRNCLDLYEELLTEEGNAKEATYNELQVEFGKCQRQIKELMKKFKEVQTQNLSLQSENQSLKKNISALIKTARGEINRKDEEINSLHQRLSEFPHFRKNYTRNYLPGSTTSRSSEAPKTKDFKSRTSHLDESPKTDPRPKNDSSKDISHSTSLPDLEKEVKTHVEKKSTSHLPASPEKHSSSGIRSRAHSQTVDRGSSEERRGRKEINCSQQYSRENDRWRKDGPGGSAERESRGADVNRRSQGQPEKYGKSEQKPEYKNSKCRSHPDPEYKSPHVSSVREKESSIRERSHQRGDSQGDERVERQSERSQNLNRKELKSYFKDDRKSDPKAKFSEKDEEQRRRCGRGAIPHPRSEMGRDPHWSTKGHPEERRGREGDGKRDRGPSDQSFWDGRPSPSTSSSRNHRRPYSNESSSKHEWENSYSKAERHRTEEKRKRERESKEESRHRSERRGSKDHLQKAEKETKKVPIEGKPKNGHEQNDRSKTSKTEDVPEGTVRKELHLEKVKDFPTAVKGKDLKLSFMEKLNLTLSPAKKQSLGQEDPVETMDRPKSSIRRDTEIPVETEAVLSLRCGTVEASEEIKSPLQEPNDSVRASEEPKVNPPASQVEIETGDLVQSGQCPLPGTDTESSPHPSVGQEGLSNGEVPASDTTAQLHSDVSPNLGLEPETVSNDGVGLPDILENAKERTSDTSVGMVDTNDESLEGDGNSVLPAVVSEKADVVSEPCLGDGPTAFDNGGNLESLFCRQGSLESSLQKDLMDNSPENRDMNPRYHDDENRDMNPEYHDDENSVISIDLNHLRYIPEAISPLNSPIRPIAKILRVESPCKVPVLRNNHKDLASAGLLSSPTKNLSNELNKENRKPVCKPDKCSETDPHTNKYSDELEEGEIVSDSEKPNLDRKADNGKSPNPRSSSAVQNGKNPRKRKMSTTHLDEDTGKTIAVKIHQVKRKKDKASSNSPKSLKAEEKDKATNSSRLEKIVQIIVEPTSVQEVMQMLKVIRKHVRKNYMKFKIKFSVMQFHRIIESAIVNFTSLIKYLDLSKICQSVDFLKRSLCDVIESKLKQLKKNGIVDRLFEQQLPDMKKKLWKFVDEQLDYLFLKLKKTLMKWCDALNPGSDSDEGRLEATEKEKQKCSNNLRDGVEKAKRRTVKVRSEKIGGPVDRKSMLGGQSGKPNPDKTQNIKPDASKQAIPTCLGSSVDNVKNSRPKVSPPAPKEFQSTPLSLRPSRDAPEAEQAVRSGPQKPERSFEILTEQQTSSLTFNLVSDAQMGEIFKSLLQGSDLLEQSVNSIDRSQWELETPEKAPAEAQKREPVSVCAADEAASGGASPVPRATDDVPWAPLSSEKTPASSTRLQMPVHPDVLDESCMFEVSTCVALSKENACSTEKRSCISSILIEDLAVSLTVPSPLKSDAHLSFLKPETSSGSTPEEVISAHFSEDALLEEEDATEQDIHLALESDNSSSRSSCSSSWTSRPVAPGFQYHPSLPMQAVIMEKSNDHFIVKIRRAQPPAASLGLDYGRTSDESVASSLRVREATDEATEEGTAGRGPADGSGTEAEMSQSHGDGRLSNEGESSTLRTPVLDVLELFGETSESMGIGEERGDEGLTVRQGPGPNESEESCAAVGVASSPLAGRLADPRVDLTPEPAPVDGNLGELLTAPGFKVHQTGPTRKDSDSQDQVGEAMRDKQNGVGEGSVDSTQTASESRLGGNSRSSGKNRDPGSGKEGEELSYANPSLGCEAKDLGPDLTVQPPSSNEVKEDKLASSSTFSGVEECPDVLAKAHRKRKKDFSLSHSKKREKKESPQTEEESKKNSPKCEASDSASQRKSANKKHSPLENKDCSSSSATSPTSLSAKNVIKKKGEVVISWTRDDDREILLECQKTGPSGKTFTFLAAKLNKNPNQVSERFQQLLKLFKKSKCR
ncbi:CASP8-associated protein 2 isoform X1 [Ornithorhynchus anatinus]|uniref:CASP8-associated protein 2 isoform X1 n=2 Tax=Ornithorhynchus anatinus TaxID=9258 RepID=UPI0010A882DE|nr:CASP8-associated protein 2 isoform X1 [Ornithorhynchus anatinus]